MLEVLDELGVEWRQVRTQIRLELDPRAVRPGDLVAGWAVALEIEVPVAWLDPAKIAAAQDKLMRGTSE